jgi:hypothetical protein
MHGCFQFVAVRKCFRRGALIGPSRNVATNFGNRPATAYTKLRNALAHAIGFESIRLSVSEFWNWAYLK